METRWRIETEEGIAFSDNWIQRREEKKRVEKVAIRVEEMEEGEDCVGTIGEGGERFNETIGGGEGGERDKQTIRVERGELERWRTIGEKRGGMRGERLQLREEEGWRTSVERLQQQQVEVMLTLPACLLLAWEPEHCNSSTASLQCVVLCSLPVDRGVLNQCNLYCSVPVWNVAHTVQSS